MMPLPICRDCRWCKYPGVKTSACMHDDASKERVDYITGGSHGPAITCAYMMGPQGPCGTEARLFEAREAKA